MKSFNLFFIFQEAVMKVFQRAVQYNDPKKVHLALLGVYERTEQHRLADELFDKMIKKFKKSCKVYYYLLYLCSPIACVRCVDVQTLS